MPLRNYLNGDLYVDGNFSCRGFSLPSGAVQDSSVAAGALGNYIQSTKLRQQIKKTYAQPNVTAVTETKPIWVAFGATGTLVAFEAGSIVAAIGAATVTLDLKKNGASVLSSVITLNNANTARIVVNATFASTAYVTGDWFDVVVVATAGGGTLPTGLFAFLVATEDPQ